jgi:hypothetical protein
MAPTNDGQCATKRFPFTFTAADEIPDAPSGKYEDFRSELTKLQLGPRVDG